MEAAHFTDVPPQSPPSTPSEQVTHFWLVTSRQRATGYHPQLGFPGALRWGGTAVQHQGTLLSRVDDRIPVHVAEADPDVTLGEPATP
jgi:hypothetical protein